MVKRFHFISTASLFEKLMAQFQLLLFRHYNSGGAPLYDPNEMEAFAPALFTQIINSILNTGTSKDRQETQWKRTIAIMHILEYFGYKWHPFIPPQHLLLYMFYLFYLCIYDNTIFLCQFTHIHDIENGSWMVPISFTFILSFLCQKMLLIFYCRLQKTAQFQKQSGLNVQLSGMSLTGLAAGLIVGFSMNPRTVLKFKNELAGSKAYKLCANKWKKHLW